MIKEGLRTHEINVIRRDCEAGSPKSAEEYGRMFVANPEPCQAFIDHFMGKSEEPDYDDEDEDE